MKKTISILLIVMMVLTVGVTGLLANAEAPAPVAEGTVGATASSAWTGNHVAADDASWSGWTAINSYSGLIDAFKARTDTSVELKLFLTADLNIDGTEWGSDENKALSTNFVLDGNGYSFVYESGDPAVFFNMKNATIKNLKLTGALTLAGGKNSPIGGTYGSNGKVTLNNVYSDMTLTGANGDRYKAMAGIISQVGDGSSFTDVVFAGSLTFVAGENRKIDIVGGIVGMGSGTVNFTNCYTTGSISIPEGSTMLGYSYSSTGTKTGVAIGLVAGDLVNANFTNCFSSGSITVDVAGKWQDNADTSKHKAATGYIGGLAGVVSGKGVFADCTNDADITDSKALSYAGGLAGIVKGGASTVTGCLNSGDISADQAAGGIIGLAAKAITVSDCTNVANITTNYMGGGIVGEAQGDFVATNCVNGDKNNYDSVQVKNLGYGSTGSLGGIVAHVKGVAKIDGCYNYAKLYNPRSNGAQYEGAKHVGGMVGLADKATYIGYDVTDVSKTGKGCFNYGSIETAGFGHTAYIGGIAGYTHPETKIYGCSNYGDITIISSAKDATGSYHGAAGILGYANGTGNCSITGCYNYGDVVDTTTGFKWVTAGIVAGSWDTVSVTISDCHNEGKISGTHVAGGIAARFTGPVTISNSTNSGAVSAKDSAGGIIGEALAATKLSAVTNSGVISSSQTATTAPSATIGGLIGYTKAATEITNSTNEGAVKVESGKYATALGGFIGYAGDNKDYSKTSAAYTITITGGENKGDISSQTAMNAADKWTFAGGILGYTNVETSINGTNNSGSVISPARVSSGGIVATVYYGKLTVTNCDNSGNISSGSGGWCQPIAGIVAHTYQATVTVTGCENTGTISFTGANSFHGVGGIVGLSQETTLTVSDCHNKGNVTSPSTTGDAGTGGVVGSVRNHKGHNVTIENCTNTAQISGKAYAGGILGKVFGDTGAGVITITGCTNSGAVSALGSGGILGGTNEVVTITACGNSGAISGTDYSGGFVGYASNTLNISGTQAAPLVNTGAISGSNIGGIVGRATGTTTISYCVNTGTITTTFTGGGMAGYLTGAATIENCVNGVEGDATKGVINGGSGSYIGGMGGALDNVTIKDCINNAPINGNGALKIGGIVGQAGGSGAITDCTNNGDITESNVATYVGGIVGDLMGAKTVSGCTNTGDILATQAERWEWSYVAGIIGSAKVNCTINNCVNLGNVTAKSICAKTAGIIANVEGAITANITNCKNGSETVKPTISSVSSSWRTPVGGIISHVSSGAHANVSGCINYGVVSISGEAGKSIHLGGIIGMIQGASATVDGCINNGDFGVNSTNAESSVAGIVGSTRDIGGKIVEIKNCQNYGDLSGGTRVGGIFGSSWSGDNPTGGADGAKLVVTKCTNYGKITTSSVGAGIVADFDGPFEISGCLNEDEVKAGTPGGILGWIYGGGTVTNCTNSGTIYSTGNDAGGIAGRTETTLVTFDTCTNTGSVSAGSRTGGIVGRGDVVTFKNCVNGAKDDSTKGAVTSRNNDDWGAAAGGILGYTQTKGAAITLTGCTNYGSVTAVNRAAGMLGYSRADQGSGSNAAISIENCTNNGEISGALYVGGMIAQAGAAENVTLKITIKNSTNSGDIIGNRSGESYVGGIVGAAKKQVTITGCTVTADATIKLTGDKGNKSTFIGGMIGRGWGGPQVSGSNMNGAIVVENVTNANEIYVGGFTAHNSNDGAKYENNTNGGSITISGSSKLNGVGGIVGRSNGSLSFNKCTNNANISITTSTFNFHNVDGWAQGVGGIIGNIGVTTTITNCTNTGNFTSSAPTAMGGIVGWATQGSLSVTGCSNSGNIENSGTHGSQWIYGGGIVGYAIVNTTISGCENTGNVTVKHFATSGGIMGAFKGAAKLKIENCTNRGACTAEHSGWCQPVGGIIGHIMTGSTNAAHVAEITGCKNYGAVTLTKQDGWGGIGGIVGMVQNGNAIISSCENHANLTGTFTAGEANVAGIVGLTRYQEGISCTLTVTGCKNFGNITGASNASGIIGQAKIEGGSTITLTVTDCTNSGTIISTGSNAGGVCANSNYTSATFSGCTNLGDISSKVYAGGIVGRSSAKVVINNCANGSAEALDANVITVLGSNSESYLGGIIAYAGGEANISNCVNYGKILNPAGTGFAKYVGGIAGGTASNATVVYNCGNKGTIVINGIHHNDHTQYVGGIVGYSVAGGRISYCYNDGAIQLNAKYADGKTTCGAAGAIVGVAGSGGKLVVDSCVNRSTITIAENITNNWAAGGVLGRTFSGCDVEIKNCVNDASAEINAILVGGIFGVADGGSKVAITNCQNRAPLTGNVVGGITSGDRGANAKITVDQCSNLGTIIGSTEGAGILAHVSSGTTATITNSVNVANVLGQARYGIAPETATVTECGFPMNLGLNGGSLIANVIGIGDKNSAMMSYYKDHLEDYINQMDAYLEEVYKLPAKYDPFTIEDLEQALEYAKSVFNTEVWVLAQDADTNEWYAVILTQARVNEAYNKLVDARAAVLYADQKIELLDRTIADAKELYNTSDIYTAESWTVFTDALHAAQDLRAFGYTNEDGSVTAIEDLDVEIIRAYIAALRDSIKNLVLGGNIYSAEDFAKLEGQKGTFYLMNDIEISAPVANFSGKLIGNGYTITLNKTALFENVDGELAIADDSQIKYASISDVNIVGNANGAESLFGKAYGLVKVSNVLIDVENVTSAALFNENEDNAEISVLYVITYSNTTDAALVSNLNNGKVEMHYVLAMTDAVALVSGNGTALAKVTYLNGVVFYDEFGVSYTDADVFASGRVAYEMNNAMAASTNAKIASTTLVQILGVDELPTVGNFTADGLNKVIKEKGTYVNASYLYSDSEIPGGDVVAPLAPIVSGLNSAIARAEALIADNYTEASWANMLKALEAAKKAVTSAKTQVGVDNARKALDIAVASLVKKLVVDTDNETGAVAGPDYTALNAAIEAAQALKYSDFTSETWSNLQTMLTMAKIAKRSTSQATIDSAVAALNGAVAGLVKAPAETDKTPVVKPTEPATEEGCGSVVGGAAVILTAVIALGAGISFKKKED